MKTLTVNIRVEDAGRDIEKHENVLKEISDISGVSLQVKKAGENSYNDYKEFLETTETDFVVFFNDKVEVEKNEIQKLVNYLNHTDGLFFQQQIETILPNPLIRENIILYFPSFVFNTKLLRSIDLENIGCHLYQEKILLDMTDFCGQSVQINTCTVRTYDILERNTSLYEPQFKKRWYQEDVEEFLFSYVKEKAPAKKDVQKRVFHSLLLRFFMNLNEKEKFTLEKDEIQRFFASVKEILQYIDDDVIAARKEYCKMPTSFTYLFLKEKHNGNLKMSVVHEKERDSYYVNGEWLENNFVGIRIHAVNYQDDMISMDCEVRGDYFTDDAEKDVYVLVNGKQIETTKASAYNLVKVFGQTVLRFYQFRFSIPVNNMNPKTVIEFSAEIKDGNIVKMPLEFKRPAARLNDMKWSYYTFGDRILVQKGRKLIIAKAKKKSVFKRECALAVKAFRSEEEDVKWLIPKLRIAYWMTKRRYEKNKLWVFYDKLYKAGDNAEYLFDYCYKHAKDVNSYYIVSEDSPDYLRLKKKYGKNILKFESFRQRLIVLHADVIFATHANVLKFCGFRKQLQKYFRNLLDAKVVCIQHGLTVQDIAQYQNRLKDNTSLYFCASKYEIFNLKRPIYAYSDKELKLTGCPRYDGLINRDKRQILIAPTWRRNIVISGNKMGTAKEYNPQFKTTKYFEIYNKLINDPRLLEAAQKYKYKLVYLIHPTLSSQAEDFDTNRYLTVLAATSGVSYEKMLTESSLMLTDYSGVQFDFAYMKKPVLYYHPEELPPQYEETVYKYDTMGFGAIITEYDEIIKELCGYMENNCVMKEKYIKRVDDFFAYTDHNNCKRIYEIIKDI